MALSDKRIFRQTDWRLFAYIIVGLLVLPYAVDPLTGDLSFWSGALVTGVVVFGYAAATASIEYALRRWRERGAQNN